MPVKHARVATPISLAETVLDKLQGLPWPMVAWLERTRNENLKVHTFRESDTEMARLRCRNLSNWVELGTYTSKAAKTDVIADVLDGMARVR